MKAKKSMGLGLYAALGMMFSALTGPSSSEMSRQKSRPCLHCGTHTSHSQPFCSAAHKVLWDHDNPGNGRYVKEQWRKTVVQECDGSITTTFCMGGRSPYVISTHNRRTPRVFKLKDYSAPGNNWNEKLFDCLIDAQRAVARELVVLS